MLAQALGVNLSQVTAASQGAEPFNAFTVKTSLLGNVNDRLQMHLGTYLGIEIKNGYRLSFDETASNQLSILVRTCWKTRTVAFKLGLNPSNRRRPVVFARDKNGLVTVEINGDPILKSRDTSCGGTFNDYLFINVGGTWAVHSV